VWLVAAFDEPVWELLAVGVELPADDATELWEAPPDVESALVLPVLATGWEGAAAAAWGAGDELW
jgi:hypothetical protein